MIARSLGLTTDLMILGWSGEVEDRGTHLRVRTPAEPDFWTGNALVVPAPVAGADAAAWLDAWLATFARELPGAAHRCLLVDGDVPAGLDVAAAGASLERYVAAVADALPARAAPSGVTLRTLDAAVAADWALLAALAITSDEAAEVVDDRHRAFIVTRAAAQRAWIAAGRGAWWGAFAADGRLIGSLGLVVGDGAQRGLARYQDVVTHPAWRRQGVASALLATAGRAALATGARTLVIVAAVDGEPLRLYRSLGFVAGPPVARVMRRPAG